MNGLEDGSQINISHLILEVIYLNNLQDKYPDVKICTDPNCELTEKDHEIFYKYEQEKEDAKKTGKELIYYEMTGDMNGNKSYRKFTEKWDGKQWVRKYE